MHHAWVCEEQLITGAFVCVGLFIKHSKVQMFRAFSKIGIASAVGFNNIYYKIHKILFLYIHVYACMA